MMAAQAAPDQAHRQLPRVQHGPDALGRGRLPQPAQVLQAYRVKTAGGFPIQESLLDEPELRGTGCKII